MTPFSPDPSTAVVFQYIETITRLDGSTYTVEVREYADGFRSTRPIAN